jgi:hypothetical protein
MNDENKTNDNEGFSKKTIEELKAKYGKVYKSEIGWTDEKQETHKISFIFREPKVPDLEAYQKTVVKNPIVANQNLFVSLVVYPAGSSLVKEIDKYIGVYTKFTDILSPFFAMQAEATMEAL